MEFVFNKTMSKQVTDTVLMIEPVAFSFNKQTATNNYFQNKLDIDASVIQAQALKEFQQMVLELRRHEVNVVVIKDTLSPLTPDSIFPNNWISFHEGGQAVMYPMFAKNRRNERRSDIVQILKGNGIVINNIDDFTFWEDDEIFLEGTGSMVLDRVNRIAYAAESSRTDKMLFFQFCKIFNYKPILFTANQTVDKVRLPIYHTNVMMSVADEYVVICLETIDNETEKETLLKEIVNSGKEIITISEEQMHNFAGNMLQVKNIKGESFLVMSNSAFNSLSNTQINRLNFYNELLVVEIPTIEKVGGGSVRCMIAEIFT